ncbi:hypothetical protein ALC57_05691 [Trachymyrmex cornetzi]|uniref:Uncharacterized protein n=1 Tax=Trachymyrmex cornetzi TaxID=471704 RepID=A0A151JA35_9HYME|nr:hypothetical protein ALC57_05691 [Trachymyrmex cornetzi]
MQSNKIKLNNIAIGDNIILPRAVWRAFIERRADIERFVQSNAPSSLSVQDLVIEIVKMRDANVVKLTLRDTCLYMKPSTVLFMFKLEHCVENVYSELCQYTHTVNGKFKSI